MTKSLAIKQYNLYMKETQMLSYAAASISFDDSTGAPKKAFKERNEVLNYFQSILFARSVSKEYQLLIANLDKYYNSLSNKYKRIVDISKKELAMNVKVPVEIMNKYQMACSEAFYYWDIAKNKSDYKIYKPYLEKVITLQKEVGKYMKDEGSSLYDTFLDMYEEGITTAELDVFFAI